MNDEISRAQLPVTTTDFSGESDHPTKSNDISGTGESPDNVWRHRIVTVPNILCTIRLTGAIGLIFIALAGWSTLFTGMFVALSLSDWIDGRLARWLNQRSDFGARLDSVADATLYAALTFGITWMRWDVIQSELLWAGAALTSYFLTTFAGLFKYGKIPSYHTLGAKTSNWLMLAGAVCLLMDISIWPFRLAMLGVTLTNLEATAITWYLPEWRADVLSIVHARSLRNKR